MALCRGTLHLLSVDTKATFALDKTAVLNSNHTASNHHLNNLVPPWSKKTPMRGRRKPEHGREGGWSERGGWIGLAASAAAERKSTNSTKQQQ